MKLAQLIFTYFILISKVNNKVEAKAKGSEIIEKGIESDEPNVQEYKKYW